MGQFIAEGGIWTWVILLLGLGALACNTIVFLGKTKRDLSGLTVALITATVLLGVAGTGMGLYAAGGAISAKPPADQVAVLANAIGIACSTTAFAACLSTVNTLIYGLLTMRSSDS